MSLGAIEFLKLAKTFRTENHKNKIIKNYAIKLKSCFDLENKNKRRINESLDLIEYCIKEFGID
tara:strand:+ start:753 stop:944 length:192 start_codon:yes stop_codon:yes gene_type:complete